MELSKDLLSQFANITKNDEKTGREKTLYGTVKIYDGVKYVKLDGSDLITPIRSTAEAKENERVTVIIRNHQAIITGNMSSPAARIDSLLELGGKVDANGNSIVQIGNTIVQMNDTITSQSNTIVSIGNNIELMNNKINAQNSVIDIINSKLETIDSDITIQNSTISSMNDQIISQNNKIELMDNIIVQHDSSITTIGSKIEIYNSSFKIENGVITGIKGVATEWITTETLEANKADIEELKTKKLDAETADIKYANIDFTNIGKAAMEYFYSQSGLIKDVTIGDASITGEIVGVKIKGDLIEGNTIVAEKLVIKGTDGLYYRLNTDGNSVESEQTEYNSLSGTVIIAKSITANKIAVEDLVAFDATIGGFRITESSLYSGVKETVDNNTRGIYLDKTGQIAFGDGSTYAKYYKTKEGKYKLDISADSIHLHSGTGSTDLGAKIEDLENSANNSIISSTEQFYQSTSRDSPIGGEWSVVQPIWIDGTYIWMRTKITYGDGRTEYSPSETGVCITGNTGNNGMDAVVLEIESSNGIVFKNNNVSTVLSVVIYAGADRIIDLDGLKKNFGNNAYLQWRVQKSADSEYIDIPSSDNRLGAGGFSFTLSPGDVQTKATFLCEIVV